MTTEPLYKAEEHAVGSREKLEELFSEVCDFLNKNSDPSSDDASSTVIRDIKAQWKCKTLDDGTLKLLSYKGNQTEIHIPSVIGRKTVTAIDATALRDDAPRITAAQKSIRKNITLIEVPGSIKMIPDGFLYRKAERESSGRYRLKESKLSSVILNEGIEAIGKDAFGNCSGIGEIVIPDSVKAIGDGAFSGCKKLEKIVLPATVHKYPDYLFQNTGLKEFTIPNHVSKIGRAAFSGCVNLEKVTLSKKLKTISESLFSACKSLKTVKITPGVREIEADAFSHSGIEYCWIPSTVKKIGSHGFFSGSITFSV